MKLLEQLIFFGIDAANGIDDLSNGAIGIKGYGLIFRDFQEINQIIDSGMSSNVHKIGSSRRLMINLENKDKNSLMQFELGDYEDLILAGAIKTLVPSLKFGGDEFFFNVWVLVITPNKKIFPAEIYYGPTRLVLAGWKKGFEVLFQKIKRKFSKELFNLTSVNIFDLSIKEKEELIQIFESLHRKIDISDFSGEYYSDTGDFLMGIKNNDPFIEKIEKRIGMIEDEPPISILHNDITWEYYDIYFKIMREHIIKEDNNIKEYDDSETYNRILIERCYDKLVSKAKKINNRLGYQLLGVTLMEYGAKMTEDVKILILRHTLWKDEKDIYKNKSFCDLRKKYLSDFRENLINYIEGNSIEPDRYYGDY